MGNRSAQVSVALDGYPTGPCKDKKRRVPRYGEPAEVQRPFAFCCLLIEMICPTGGYNDSRVKPRHKKEHNTMAFAVNTTRQPMQQKRDRYEWPMIDEM